MAMNIRGPLDCPEADSGIHPEPTHIPGPGKILVEYFWLARSLILWLVSHCSAALNHRRMRSRIGTGAIFCVLSAVFLFEVARNAVSDDAALLRLGALPDSGWIQLPYWRLISAGLLHYTFSHLALNLLLLLLLGPIVERRAGMPWLFAVFLIASMASFLAILIKHQIWPAIGVSLGASGGMFGLLGAALVLISGRSAENRRVRAGLIVVLALGLAYSVLPHVSMIGHVVGAATGAMAAFVSSLMPVHLRTRGAERAQIEQH